MAARLLRPDIPTQHAPTNAQHIAAIEGAGCFDVDQRPVRLEGVRHCGHFRATRRRTGPREDRQFIDDNSDVLDENRVRQIRRGGQAEHLAAEGSQHGFVSVMLRAGQVHVDGFAHQVCQFAAPDAGADVTGDGNAQSSVYGESVSFHQRPTRKTYCVKRNVHLRYTERVKFRHASRNKSLRFTFHVLRFTPLPS